MTLVSRVGAASMEREIDTHSQSLCRVRTTRDILQEKVINCTGLIYGLQDGVAFEDDLERIHELNILLDLSHCGRKTARDAFSVSDQPVSFTHTGCHALAEHPSHRTYAELRAAAESGGIIGIFVMPYLARGNQPTADIAAPFETETGYLFAGDLNSARRLETLGERLLQKDYSQTRVEKIIGLNLLRVYRAAWGS